MDNQAEGRFDVVVAGTGPAGLIAALGFAGAGFRVALAGPRANRADRRTTALMVPALAELEALGILDALAKDAAPLRAIRIVDATRRLVRSPTVTFHASEIGEPHFGLNIPNAVLNGVLEDAVAGVTGIHRFESLVSEWSIGPDRATATLDDGTAISGSLVVAADGRASPARAAADIEVSTRPFAQSALALTFSHGRGHSFISTEFHTETGPFTQVPLPGNRSSLVWVVAPKTAAELSTLDAGALSRRIEERMDSMLGEIAVDPGCQVYPLAASLPRRFARNRVALVGEAAHLFPPIGAQGLNLGIRDVRHLLDTATAHRDDPGGATALSAYDAKRRPDILARTGAVSLLNRSLLSDLLPAQMARSAGLAMLGASGPLRGLFMREGLSPGSGLRALASTLREQVRR